MLRSKCRKALKSTFSLLSLSEPRAHMVAMACVFFAIGITLILQPHRYDNTPSYANLLIVMGQAWWGSLYVFAGVMKIVSIVRYRFRTLVVITHTYSIIILSIWLSAFIIRWLTDSGTTIVNVCSWSIFLYLVIRSALMLDDHVAGRRE